MLVTNFLGESNVEISYVIVSSVWRAITTTDRPSRENLSLVLSSKALSKLTDEFPRCVTAVAINFNTIFIENTMCSWL